MVTLVLAGIAAIALGYWEASTISLLRHTLRIPDGAPNILLLEQLTGRALRMEKIREVSTCVVILILSMMTSRSILHSVLLFGWTYAVWNLAYYGWLRLLVHWPRSLLPLDILSFVPRPWLAPVWLPIMSSALIALGCGGALLWLTLW